MQSYSDDASRGQKIVTILISALETIAMGNTDPDRMVEIAKAALADLQEYKGKQS